MDIDINKLPKKAARKSVEINLLVNFAKELNYHIVKIDYHNGLIRFENGGININLYATNFTITTELNHPTKGKTQLHRKNLTTQEVCTVFRNPRQHTGVGYYKK